MDRITTIFLLLALTGCGSAKEQVCESNVTSAFSRYQAAVNADQPEVARFFSQEFLVEEVDSLLDPETLEHNLQAVHLNLLLGRAKSVGRTVTCDKVECTLHADKINDKGEKEAFEFIYPLASCDDPKISKIVRIINR